MKKVKSVLLVEDSESEHIIAEIAISRYDKSITVHKAFDGSEALKMLAGMTAVPDVILLDINMPGMDGLEFLQTYSKSKNTVSTVVMLTSSDETSDKQKCEAYSFVKDYIVKPLDTPDVARIASLLD